MWTNRASGNISSKSPIRAVCGGDLRTSGRSYFRVSFLRKRSTEARHRASSSPLASRKVRKRS
jgi:hypothetical protein